MAVLLKPAEISLMGFFDKCGDLPLFLDVEIQHELSPEGRVTLSRVVFTRMAAVFRGSNSLISTASGLGFMLRVYATRSHATISLRNLRPAVDQ